VGTPVARDLDFVAVIIEIEDGWRCKNATSTNHVDAASLADSITLRSAHTPVMMG
jgi:hypothetical protein